MSLKNFADKTAGKKSSNTFQGFNLSTMTEKPNKLDTKEQEENKLNRVRVRVRRKWDTHPKINTIASKGWQKAGQIKF